MRIYWTWAAGAGLSECWNEDSRGVDAICMSFSVTLVDFNSRKQLFLSIPSCFSQYFFSLSVAFIQALTMSCT
jgi:hypothetical protein